MGRSHKQHARRPLGKFPHIGHQKMLSVNEEGQDEDGEMNYFMKDWSELALNVKERERDGVALQ